MPSKRLIKVFNALDIPIVIEDEVHDIFNEFRQLNKTDLESCGVLIGGYFSATNKIVIDACTTPYPSDIRRRASYVMTDLNHQKAIDTAFQKSDGLSYFIGTWHSHPEPYPSPSLVDLNDWKKIMQRNRKAIPAFLFIIVGTKQVSAFPFINTKYRNKTK